MRKLGMTRKKTEKSRYQGVRPYVHLSDEENREIEHSRIDQGLDKSEYMKLAALYCSRNKIDLRKK